MRSNPRLTALLLGGVLLFFSSCATVPALLPLEPSLDPPETPPQWVETGRQGLALLSYAEEDRPVRLVALALDLRTPGLQFVITSPDPGKKGETRSAKVSEFVRAHNLAAAINGAPYSPANPLNRQGRPSNIAGIYIYEGERISPPVPSFDAFYVLRDGSVRIGSQRDIPEDCRWAVGGFHAVLSEGRNVGRTDVRHPRSLIGYAPGSGILYLVVADGRQQGSAGLTTEEAGRWMLWLGASEAINMDGGGSSALVLRRKEEPVLLSSPVHRGRPGLERSVGSHIGISLPE